MRSGCWSHVHLRLRHGVVMSAALAACVLMRPGGAAAGATPLLPDLIAWENESLGYMHDGEFDTTTDPTRALYRFSVAIPNIGDGPFEVFEETHPDQTQDVYQNIYDSEGGVTQVLMGSFPDADPAFGHLFLVGLARYSLREVAPGGGVGPVVSSHDKTSFGLVDSVAYDLALPGAPQSRVYTNVLSNPLGVSIGWADLYSRNLPKQWVDATGLPDGQYWLEAEIDPTGFVQETDDTNNITRVLVDLTVPNVQLLLGDANGDDQVTGADLISVQQNFGACGPIGTVPGDANHDGCVTGADLISVQQNFGNAQAPSGASVPEPGTLGLVWIAVLGFARRLRSR